jgi:hypothetical protein
MDLIKDLGCEGEKWIHVAENKDHWVGSCEHSNELSGYINGVGFLG